MEQSRRRNFNPRSREGSDHEQLLKKLMERRISIHAPARGATDAAKFVAIRGHDISIHAPARGATKRRTDMKLNKDFNPRSREGSDSTEQLIDETPHQFQSTLPRGERRESDGGSDRVHHISIHAPARGATTTDHHVWSCVQFQSTLPRGERRQR